MMWPIEVQYSALAAHQPKGLWSATSRLGFDCCCHCCPSEHLFHDDVLIVRLARQHVAVCFEKFPPAWPADRPAFHATHMFAQIALKIGQQVLPFVPPLAGQP